MSRNLSQQYWYSLTTLVYALVLVCGTYWHYCGQVDCYIDDFRSSDQISFSIDDDSESSVINQSSSQLLQELAPCVACLLSELRQVDNSASYEIRTIVSDACCSMSSRMFDIEKLPNPISARGPPQLTSS